MVPRAENSRGLKCTRPRRGGSFVARKRQQMARLSSSRATQQSPLACPRECLGGVCPSLAFGAYGAGQQGKHERLGVMQRAKGVFELLHHFPLIERQAGQIRGRQMQNQRPNVGPGSSVPVVHGVNGVEGIQNGLAHQSHGRLLADTEFALREERRQFKRIRASRQRPTSKDRGGPLWQAVFEFLHLLQQGQGARAPLWRIHGFAPRRSRTRRVSPGIRRGWRGGWRFGAGGRALAPLFALAGNRRSRVKKLKPRAGLMAGVWIQGRRRVGQPVAGSDDNDSEFGENRDEKRTHGDTIQNCRSPRSAHFPRIVACSAFGEASRGKNVSKSAPKGPLLPRF